LEGVVLKVWQTAFTAAVISALVAGGVATSVLMNQVPTQSTSTLSDSYSRIISGKTIRCGYVIALPYTIRDPNSGKLSGLSFDTMEMAAKQAGYKLNWAEEVGWATMIEGLQTGRNDMICSGVWLNSARAQFADFTMPIFYNVIGVYVRSEDNRFSNSLSVDEKYAAVNEPDVTIATVDGEITSTIADESFPQARRLAVP
jgi:polar amino acid transport system substrate-binding protein